VKKILKSSLCQISFCKKSSIFACIKKKDGRQSKDAFMRFFHSYEAVFFDVLPHKAVILKGKQLQRAVDIYVYVFEKGKKKFSCFLMIFL